MITVKSQPFDRNFASVMGDLAGPDARAKILAAAARDAFAEADAANAAAVGHAVPALTVVDGVKTDRIDQVHAEGAVVRRYDLMPMVLAQISMLLWKFSPVRTGRYQRSHQLFADGEMVAEITDGWVMPALSAVVQEYVFAPGVPYATLIEPHDGLQGESRQEPDGVYHVIAVMASAVFGALASIVFDYRNVPGHSEPWPVIVIRPV